MLLAVGGYGYGSKDIDRRDEVAEIRAGLPDRAARRARALRAERPRRTRSPGTSCSPTRADPAFEPVPFDHPLCVLFSSGTTGKPKAIVHGHGGILLEHLKNHALSWDLRPGDRILWFSTTAWMMWNALVSGLLVGASIVLIDGNPLHPDLRLAVAAGRGDRRHADGREPRLPHGVPAGGAAARGRVRPVPGPADRRGGQPAARRGLPLGGRAVRPGRAAQRRQRRHRRLHRDRAGQPAAAGLGRRDLRAVPRGRRAGVRREGQRGRRRARRAGHHRADAVDAGRVLGRPGRRPLPGHLLRRLPGRVAPRRLGAVLRGRQLSSSPAVRTPRSTAAACGWAPRSSTASSRSCRRSPTAWSCTWRTRRAATASCCCSCSCATGVELDDELRRRISTALRTELSPRHVPDEIVAVPAVPRNRTGKKLELPVKKILRGAARRRRRQPRRARRPHLARRVRRPCRARGRRR